MAKCNHKMLKNNPDLKFSSQFINAMAIIYATSNMDFTKF